LEDEEASYPVGVLSIGWRSTGDGTDDRPPRLMKKINNWITQATSDLNSLTRSQLVHGKKFLFIN